MLIKAFKKHECFINGDLIVLESIYLYTQFPSSIQSEMIALCNKSIKDWPLSSNQKLRLIEKPRSCWTAHQEPGSL